jgi:hypothetical protein
MIRPFATGIVASLPVVVNGSILRPLLPFLLLPLCPRELRSHCRSGATTRRWRARVRPTGGSRAPGSRVRRETPATDPCWMVEDRFRVHRGAPSSIAPSATITSTSASRSREQCSVQRRAVRGRLAVAPALELMNDSGLPLARTPRLPTLVVATLRLLRRSVFVGGDGRRGCLPPRPSAGPPHYEVPDWRARGDHCRTSGSSGSASPDSSRHVRSSWPQLLVLLRC